MACYHPIVAFARTPAGSTKRELVFPSVSTKDQSTFIKDGKLYSERLLLPCGQCVGCRLEYSRQWATRCVLEAMQYENNYFVTLTYDDEHISELKRCYDDVLVDESTGEVVSVNAERRYTLCPDHLTKFIKDLRRYFEYHFEFKGIRFFACGEYGDEKERPHFHVILFNCPLPDVYYWKSPKFKGSKPYRRSHILEKIWPRGFVCVGDVSFKSCAYVARYMMKKQKGFNAKHFYDDRGLVPPFTRCSRKPGIAKSYFDENSGKIYEVDRLYIAGADGSAVRVRPPAYYDRLLDNIEPELLCDVKERRKESGIISKKAILSRTDLSEEDYLLMTEESALCSLKKLVRPVT